MNYIDHISHAKSGTKPFPDRLYVVTAIINPQRFRTRYELYNAFEKHIADSGAILYTVEVAFGGRDFEVTQPDNPRHLQLRTSTELWHKENALNLLMARLPADWKYVAWIDADVHFARPNWAQETLHSLQHYSVVQPWGECLDLGPDGQVVNENMPSMMHQYIHATGWDANLDPYYSKERGHCGYAWAARREAIDALGGLLDASILGANDHHMSLGLVGEIEKSYNGQMSPQFKHALAQWESRAEEHIKRNVGYIPGLIMHNWHGAKKYRRYIDRWQVLVKHQYDPYVDIKRDSQGLYVLTGNKIGLRDDLRAYFRQRNEDSIEVP
jgi:hypothetical protein